LKTPVLFIWKVAVEIKTSSFNNNFVSVWAVILPYSQKKEKCDSGTLNAHCFSTDSTLIGAQTWFNS
jgi:hypothetical protein